MNKKYKTENDLRDLVRRFEEASILREEWKHEEHLLVALCYLEGHGLEHGTERMSKGIMNLLTKGFAIDLSKEMPYHETLTVFWMRTVFAFSLLMGELALYEKAAALTSLFDKDYPLRFYSRERLFSDEARSAFLAPDLSPSISAPGVASPIDLVSRATKAR